MSILTDLSREMRVYQPIPFEGWESVACTRSDTVERYEAIKSDYGSFDGKTMYDLCSANCYFGFRFLQEGGRFVSAVECDDATRAFVEALAKDKDMSLSVHKDIGNVYIKHDIGIYLDTHYAEGTDGYLDHMGKMAEVLYTSSSRDDFRYWKLLQEKFKSVEHVMNGLYNRSIYRCKGAK